MVELPSRIFGKPISIGFVMVCGFWNLAFCDASPPKVRVLLRHKGFDFVFDEV